MKIKAAISKGSITRVHVLTFVDQALFSGANFLFGVGLIHAFGTTKFAAYGIGLSAALLLQSLQRGFNIKLALIATAEFTEHKRRLLGAHVALLATCLLLPGLSYIGLELVGVRESVLDLLAATIACIAIYFQAETNRIFLVKAGAQWKAPLLTCVTFLAYSGAVCCGYIYLASFRVAMLGISGIIVLFSAIVIWREIRPDILNGVRQLFSVHRGVIGWTTLGTLASSVYAHWPVFLLGIFHPSIYTTAYVATRNLLQPLQILVRGLDTADKHHFANLDKDRFGACLRALARNLLAAGIYCLPILLFSGAILRLTYGEQLVEFEAELRLWIFPFAAIGLLLPLESRIYYYKLERGYSISLLFSSAAVAMALVPLVIYGNAIGAIVASFLGYSLHAAIAARYAFKLSQNDKIYSISISREVS